MKLQKIINRISKFSDTTFGNDRSFKAPLYHLKKEVDELIESDGDPYEYADCLLLLVDSFRMRFPEHRGSEALLLTTYANQKIDICKNRKWSKPDANGVIEHVRKQEKS